MTPVTTVQLTPEAMDESGLQAIPGAQGPETTELSRPEARERRGVGEVA
jgi:hypothetical protein